jgi:hypothetical protein
MYFPISQTVQLDDSFLLLYEPGRHVSQAVAPTPDENRPTPHDWHALTPVVTGWNFPVEQLVHTEELVLVEKVPAAQITQVWIPVPVV